MRTANLAFSSATALVVAVFFIFTSLKSEDQREPIKLRKADHSFDFVRSFEGTTQDGNLSHDGGSELQVSAELRLLFDYYLTATGEKKLPEIRAEIERVLDQKLSANAALQAKNLLGRYIQYKQALVSVEANAQNISAGKTSMATAARQRWSAMQQTRQRFFSEKENQAMFGFDDAYDMDALNRMDVAENASLNPEQKQAQLQALDDALPVELREEKNAPYQVIRLEEQASKLRANGASDADIYNMRATATSAEAATRLAEVDREEAIWKARIQQYQEQKNKLNTEMSFHSATEKQAALDQVRKQYFNADEQRRLPAYE
ncbi:lipase secretion chaperone [Undibacterium umbellatum]|uniref:Lipase helper protein n=1 Tax=Undibacterium umbellatum TaxID=2762300 RepID=A0ABR6ZHT6_9BURK|nr:lipase secretion chaperone [Undibacterium umbellatum]MBC3911285.1 lipase chaperone [Undibacterium umbellatum]